MCEQNFILKDWEEYKAENRLAKENRLKDICIFIAVIFILILVGLFDKDYI